jgi:hypothetical protein
MFKYRNIRIGLLTLTLGLAVVYSDTGRSIANRNVAIDLPKASTDILYVKPNTRSFEAFCDPENLNDLAIKPKIFEYRDWINYQFGGYRGCGLSLDCTERSDERSVAKARQFIWDHWKRKIRGYVVITVASVDAESHAHVFVEPDASGNWRIVWTWERIFGIDSCPGDVDKTSDIRIIKWAVASEDDWVVSPGTRYLKLIDEDGKDRSF